MPTITIEFAGVCTHIRGDEVPHRVVLINAREERDFGAKGRVPPHAAKLGGKRLADPVRLEIRGAAGSGVTYADNWFTLMPRLVEGDQPFELSDGVRGLGDPELVDAWLDVHTGHFEVVCHGKAFGARLTIETTDEPKLVISPMGGPGAGEEIALGTHTRIEHMAVGTHGDDDASHFLLHYLIAKDLPDYAAGNTRACSGRQAGPPSLGPGCSNSDFP